MEGYRKIEFLIGNNIESAIKELKKHNDLVCGEFNGVTLYSDVDDLDSAYKKITGRTKAEFDEAERKRQAEYEREKLEHEKSIPRLTKEWIEKGKSILDKKYHEKWAECVPIRLGDMYRGMELGCTLELVEKINNGDDFEEIKNTFMNQGHSGMSFGLTCSMIKSFCDKGAEFVEYAA